MSEHVEITREGGVMTLLLDRADKKNALSNAMYDALTGALAEAAADDTRAVVIGSKGEDFTAGNDLGDFAKVAMGEVPRALGFIEAIGAFPKPLVAAVRGRAVGVGLTMLLHCDLVYAAEDARLSAPFAGLALVPEAASSLLLPARIGHALAFEIFTLGRVLSGAEAATLGLANTAMAADAVLPAAREAAARLAALSVGSLAETKRLMRDTDAVKAQMAAENQVFFARLKSSAAREAFTAFMQKRAPNFVGLD